MSRYGNRRSNNKGGDDSSSRSSKRSGGSKYNNNVEFVGLGDLSLPKSQSGDQDVQDIAADLKDMEVKFNLKVFVGRNEEITLRNGDVVMIKFKDYENAKEWVDGKAFLITND